MYSKALLALGLAAAASAHSGHDQEPLSGPHEGLWYKSALPGDGGTQVSFFIIPFATFFYSS